MFTSTDVYDAASSIGRECQLIVGEYGPEILQDLMPSVISVLEELEACAIYAEREQDEVTRLQNVLEALRAECRLQADSKEKYDRNLEQLEQSWYCETQRLLQQVGELEDENNKLAQQLASECHLTEDHDDFEESNGANGGKSTAQVSVSKILKAVASGRPCDLPKNLAKLPQKTNVVPNVQEDDLLSQILSETEERIQLTEQENRVADLQLIGRLKECIASNYRTIRSLNRELLQTGTALDAAEEEVCRLARQSGKLMVSRAPHRRQRSQLVAEKSAIEAKLRMKERELNDLNQCLPTDDDAAAISSVAACSGDTGTKENGAKGSHNALTVSPTAAPPPTFRLSPGQGIESTLCAGNTAKPTTSDAEGLVTLEELRHLLYERNELRCRLIELEQELELLELENAKDPEVEGPMPPEPIEKLRPDWPKKPSIKAIFHQLLHRLGVPD